MFDLDNDPMDTSVCVYLGCSNPVDKGCCVCTSCHQIWDEWVAEDRKQMEEARAEAVEA